MSGATSDKTKAVRAGLGWRAHSGWAVGVVVSGEGQPVVAWRERVELGDGSLPRQPYHAVADAQMPPAEAAKLISRVERAATTYAAAVTREVVRSFGVEAVGVVGGERQLPGELERLLASHLLLHAAEGDLYEQALVAAAAAAGLSPLLVPPRSVDIPEAIDRAGKLLGPPWQKDHKFAAVAALRALAAARRG
jgi:hypothetical protein